MTDTRSRSTHIKAAVTVAMAVLTIIVLFQNTEPVQTRALFGTFSMPLAALLALLFGSGALAGSVLGRRWAGRKQIE